MPPLVVYLLTMAPGLIARGDTPKFQYVGYILGTPHPPGYPLFIFLSWAFGKLPIADVAWRVNFMTALFGALAAGAMVAAARQLGADRGAALLAAWGLAFGPVFWAQATGAEVYTLATFLQLTVFALVFRWQRTRHDRDLLAAVAVAALALGHHPTIFMIAPLLAVFVLLVDWRVLLRPSVVVGTAALVALGFAQYAYVVLRTFQGAPYIEASARNASQLLDVLRGKQFASFFFGFTWEQLLDQRLGFVVGFISTELTIAGLVLALIGVAWLLRTNWRAAALVLATGVTIFFFALTYDVPDTQVFLVPVFMTLWLLAGVGAALVARIIARDRGWAGALSLAAAGTLAVVLVSRSYAAEDLSAETFDRRLVSAFLAQIETPAVVYFDHDDALSHAVRYGLLVDHAARGRVSIGRLHGVDPRRNWSDEVTTYTFEPARRLIESRGIFMTPVALTSPDSAPFDADRVPVFRGVGLAPCRDGMTNSWSILDRDVLMGPRLTAWVGSDLQMPRRTDDMQVTVIVGADRAALEVGAYMSDGEEVSATLESFDTADPAARDALYAELARATLTSRPPTRFVARATFPFPLTPDGHADLVLATGPSPTWVAIFVRSRRTTGVRYCGAPPDGAVLLGDRSISQVELARSAGFGTWGWHNVERNGDDRYRWTSAARADLEFALAAPEPLTLVVEAEPARPAGARIGVEVNGRRLPEQLMTETMRNYEWELPSSDLRGGANLIVLIGPDPVTPKAMGHGDDTRELSLRVRRAELRRAAR
ncbi:MAG TPA: DUF2723 domain-containing protein [Vicinamibacterales bacterium]|nr:DUF2723 domain-containing protein [Vicinamibacterales bacterium]